MFDVLTSYALGMARHGKARFGVAGRGMARRSGQMGLGA